MGVVTSVIPVAYIVQELGGERVRVHALVPPGASPHTFEPVPSDLRKLVQARLFVVVGGGFDAWSDKLLGAAPKGLETLTLFDAPNLKPLEGDDDHHGEEQAAKEGGEKKGEEEEEFNPPFLAGPDTGKRRGRAGGGGAVDCGGSGWQGILPASAGKTFTGG